MNFIYFVSGVILTSVIWFVFFQVKVYEITTKDHTKIVFHKTTPIITDKTLDKEMKNALIAHSEQANTPTKSFFSLFKSNEPAIVNAPIPQVVNSQTNVKLKYHTVSNGDSLWLIAREYYSEPSPKNIDKIMKANNMNKVVLLYPGQKLTIPM